MTTPSPAPTVRPNPAQGTALGTCPALNQALKGRTKGRLQHMGRAKVWIAPSGLSSCAMDLPRALPWAAIESPFGAEPTNGTRRNRQPARRRTP